MPGNSFKPVKRTSASGHQKPQGRRQVEQRNLHAIDQRHHVGLRHQIVKLAHGAPLERHSGNGIHQRTCSKMKIMRAGTVSDLRADGDQAIRG